MIFKHYKEEADIASMTWKIDLDEVTEIKHGGVGERTDYCSNKRRMSGGSVVSR